MDNLSKDMLRCKADGFGCHYGHWKALQAEKDVQAIPSTAKCKYCGGEFAPRRRNQLYCSDVCKYNRKYERDRARLMRTNDNVLEEDTDGQGGSEEIQGHCV